MQTNPVVDSITIYPVKSLDGISLQTAQIGNGGCLLHDREYAIVDRNDKFVKGKNSDLVYLLRSKIDFETETISFRQQSEETRNRFHLQKDKHAINEFLSSFFKIPVTLIRNTEGEFLDIPVQSGVTVLSKASLQTVGAWFNDMDLDETRKRFRATIEITGVPAFWEDKHFLEEGTAIEFKIGDITLYGGAHVPGVWCQHAILKQEKRFTDFLKYLHNKELRLYHLGQHYQIMAMPIIYRLIVTYLQQKLESGLQLAMNLRSLAKKD